MGVMFPERRGALLSEGQPGPGGHRWGLAGLPASE